MCRKTPVSSFPTTRCDVNKASASRRWSFKLQMTGRDLGILGSENFSFFTLFCKQSFLFAWGSNAHSAFITFRIIMPFRKLIRPFTLNGERDCEVNIKCAGRKLTQGKSGDNTKSWQQLDVR